MSSTSFRILCWSAPFTRLNLGLRSMNRLCLWKCALPIRHYALGNTCMGQFSEGELNKFAQLLPCFNLWLKLGYFGLNTLYYPSWGISHSWICLITKFTFEEILQNNLIFFFGHQSYPGPAVFQLMKPCSEESHSWFPKIALTVFTMSAIVPSTYASQHLSRYIVIGCQKLCPIHHYNPVSHTLPGI